jgi:hypothetical protein
MSSKQTDDVSSRQVLQGSWPLSSWPLLTHQPLIANVITHGNIVHFAQEKITLNGEWGDALCQL